MEMNRTSDILIIDDDISICTFVLDALTGDGYSCEIALNAQDAFNKIQNHRYDLVLLDIKLPDKSGIELLECSQSFFYDTSIIMMTAIKDFDVAIQAMRMGASDYIVKPFTVAQLTQSINNVLTAEDKTGSFPEMIEYPYSVKRNLAHSSKTITALAIGVEAQVDYFDFHSRRVTEKVVNLARRFGLPEKEINRWEITRNRLFTDRMGRIKSMLIRLEHSPFAQLLLGITYPKGLYYKERGEQN
ncbi:MAG: hypothetical protein A2158_00705 [Chloroflexi bacterium RBG_13_46_14]|nr:MAG: hypothetical protein A2158_00705 [Chloroflexi bacterium RBG_13_46_14]